MLETYWCRRIEDFQFKDITPTSLALDSLIPTFFKKRTNDAAFACLGAWGFPPSSREQPKVCLKSKLKSRPDKMIELGNKIINLQDFDVHTLGHEWYNLFFYN